MTLPQALALIGSMFVIICSGFGYFVKRLDKRIDEIATLIHSTDQAVISVKVARAEQDILDLRKWKHEKADPYIGAMNAMKDRVDSLWRKVFNGHRE